jgi:hypothetical protein
MKPLSAFPSARQPRPTPTALSQTWRRGRAARTRPLAVRPADDTGFWRIHVLRLVIADATIGQGGICLTGMAWYATHSPNAAVDAPNSPTCSKSCPNTTRCHRTFHCPPLSKHDHCALLASTLRQNSSVFSSCSQRSSALVLPLRSHSSYS